MDPNFRTNCPPAIRGKITELINAAHEAAFAGTLDPQDAESVRNNRDWARYCLETTILTHLERARTWAS